MTLSKAALISTLFIIGAPLLLSMFAHVPYIYTVLGMSVWAFVGHAITLDDDIPGAWSNMERSEKVWRNSRIELLVKGTAMLVFVYLVMAYPELAIYGGQQK